MASKLERMRQRMRNASKAARTSVAMTIHSAETLGAAAVTGYVSGRMADADGEFGFRGVPYPLIAAGVLYLGAFYTGIKAPGDGRSMGDDMLAIANGIASAHIGRVTYEMGQTAQAQTQGVGPVRQFAPSHSVGFGTGFDSIRERMAA